MVKIKVENRGKATRRFNITKYKGVLVNPQSTTGEILLTQEEYDNITPQAGFVVMIVEDTDTVKEQAENPSEEEKGLPNELNVEEEVAEEEKVEEPDESRPKKKKSSKKKKEEPVEEEQPETTEDEEPQE